MLEQEFNKKIRKNNLYIVVDKFRITNLHLDLWTSKIFIDVEFFRDNRLVHINSFEFNELNGDTDVNKLIEELKNNLENEYGKPII
jgi:hypothetical protein